MEELEVDVVVRMPVDLHLELLLRQGLEGEPATLDEQIVVALDFYLEAMREEEIAESRGLARAIRF